MDPSDNLLTGKCTDDSNALVYGLLVGPEELLEVISKDVELCDMMCMSLYSLPN